MEQLTWSPLLLESDIIHEPNANRTQEVPADGGTQTTAASPFANQSFLFMMVIFLLVLYFFMIRPQSKKQKETQRMLASLEKGDRVMTSSGIFGTIDTVKETSFILKLNDNVKVEFAKYAVTQVLEKKNPVPQPETKKSIFSGFRKKKTETEASAEKTASGDQDIQK
ncbi:MAG: preprotein translocase subunit YajC [Spirochaetia bacterium]|nr:preprotein translocase subunit YajC [Spirochaetia bacterium]